MSQINYLSQWNWSLLKNSLILYLSCICVKSAYFFSYILLSALLLLLLLDTAYLTTVAFVFSNVAAFSLPRKPQNAFHKAKGRFEILQGYKQSTCWKFSIEFWRNIYKSICFWYHSHVINIQFLLVFVI